MTSGRWTPFASLLLMGALAGQAVLAQQESSHEKCLKATDYKGCIESQGNSKAEEQLTTGILWDTATWKDANTVVRIKAYRMRGGGFWIGNSMRLSVIEVDCKNAQFDVESDGYSKQSIEGDAWRQAPLIYSRFCTKKPASETPAK